MYEKIYLHVGLPKTGSTYLQSALDVLSRRGALVHTSYPVLHRNHDFRHIQSGNGQFVAGHLLVENVPEFSLETASRLLLDILNAADTSKPNLLISSELFSRAAPQSLACLLDLLGSHARTVEILVLVRPVDRLCRAGYHQKVKRHARFEEYDENFVNIFSERLVSIVSMIGNVSNKVTILDYRPSDLIGLFLQALGEDPRLGVAVGEQSVNRSLTSAELNILRTINSVFRDSKLAKRISDRWIYANPEALGDPGDIDRTRIVELFRQVVADNVTRLESATCQTMLQRLLSNGGTTPAMDAAAARRPETATPDRTWTDSADLLRMALEEIATEIRPDQSINRYTRGLTPTRERFDPVHYLLLNRDVLAAGVDPVKHHEQSGRREGRYTAFDTASAASD